MNFYIFGIQRSGTNLMERILIQSVNGRKQNNQKTAWKHAIDIPKGMQNGTPIIVIHKNPYLWAESICDRNKVDWIQTQKRYPADKGPPELRAGKHNLNVQALAKTYSHFYHTWIFGNPQLDTFVIRYEDLLNQHNRTKVLDEMANHFNVKNGQKINWNIPQRGKVSQSKDYDEKTEQYYINQTPQILTPEQTTIITNTIGAENIQSLGYVPL